MANVRKPSATAKKKPTAKAAAKAAQPGNGMETFSMHAFDKATSPMVNKLMQERGAHAAFALTAPESLSSLDPETVAKRYLNQALESPDVKPLTAPKVDNVESEFKSLGTVSIPLTGTKMVKFRQTINKIPVYGSLISVELDDNNNLVSIGSSMAKPSGVNPIARISAAEAIEAIEKYPGYKKQLDHIVPQLHYYFERPASKWRLVYIFESVPVTPKTDESGKKQIAAGYMDYVVDAHSGKVVGELPRLAAMAASVDTALDGLNVNRTFAVEQNGGKKSLFDATLGVRTYDFKFADPVANSAKLPGSEITSPPPWPASAVSAHANASEVAKFLRQVLMRNNIDDNGGIMVSSINCVDNRYSPDGRQWFNAFWNGTQMVYGQRLNGNSLLSLSVDLDVVGHEMFHGVTEKTAKLQYAFQSGALNESISDIFGVIIANFQETDIDKWSWKVGEGLRSDGKAFRDMSDPPAFKQPDHMRDYVSLPFTENGDYGGVHVNSGIHNKAAYLILTAKDNKGNPILSARDVAGVFYLALTQQLSRTSEFVDSRRAALTSARTLFRNLPPDKQTAKIDAIASGFDRVGIK